MERVVANRPSIPVDRPERKRVPEILIPQPRRKGPLTPRRQVEPVPTEPLRVPAQPVPVGR